MVALIPDIVGLTEVLLPLLQLKAIIVTNPKTIADATKILNFLIMTFLALRKEEVLWYNYTDKI